MVGRVNLLIKLLNLYGTTNKRNAEHQIAKRVQRLEHASLALDRKRLHNRKQQKATEQEDTNAEGDSDL